MARLQRELTGSLPGIRWVNPATIHLTLGFSATSLKNPLKR
jgi:2'-5' RNA ligase